MRRQHRGVLVKAHSPGRVAGGDRQLRAHVGGAVCAGCALRVHRVVKTVAVPWLEEVEHVIYLCERGFVCGCVRGKVARQETTISLTNGRLVNKCST